MKLTRNRLKRIINEEIARATRKRSLVLESDEIIHMAGDVGWEYKKFGDLWHTRKQGSDGEWISISDNAEAVATIEAAIDSERIVTVPDVEPLPDKIYLSDGSGLRAPFTCSLATAMQNWPGREDLRFYDKSAMAMLRKVYEQMGGPPKVTWTYENNKVVRGSVEVAGLGREMTRDEQDQMEMAIRFLMNASRKNRDSYMPDGVYYEEIDRPVDSRMWHEELANGDFNCGPFSSKWSREK